MKHTPRPEAGIRPFLPTRREHLRALAGLAASAVAMPVLAQTRNTTIIVPFGPGGATDITARMLAQYLPDRVMRRVQIEGERPFGPAKPASEAIAPTTVSVRAFEPLAN